MTPKQFEQMLLKDARRRNVNARETIFSPDRAYRYTLWREWGLPSGLPYGRYGKNGFEPLPLHTKSEYVMFIGLNPSTADETKDDPTIRKCIGFAKRWGYGALCMTNLFAFIATQSSDMLKEPWPIGNPENDSHLLTCASGAGIIIAAWGTKGGHRERDKEVLAMIGKVKALRITKHGFPEHPLYVPYDVTPMDFNSNQSDHEKTKTK